MPDDTAEQIILTHSIKEKKALYRAYMPFIINGGLFIPTEKEYRIGSRVSVLLSLMEEAESLPIDGKIIWKTPINSDGYRIPGIGFQFSEQDNGNVRNKIENYLIGVLASNNVTDTM